MRPLVKICGIKTVDEAQAVANLDVNFLGVIFAPSKRKVTPKIAKEISRIAHEKGKLCVGVFAEISENEIEKICEFANLDVAQIYGDYSLNLKENLARKNIKIWKVYSVLDALGEVDFNLCDMPLFDCKGENLGGNGISFDWRILKDLEPFSFALAGGISAKNISQAIDFKPLVIDINSKVEDKNMIKNPDKIKEILEIIGEKEIS